MCLCTKQFIDLPVRNVVFIHDHIGLLQTSSTGLSVYDRKLMFRWRTETERASHPTQMSPLTETGGATELCSLWQLVSHSLSPPLLLFSTGALRDTV